MYMLREALLCSIGRLFAVDGLVLVARVALVKVVVPFTAAQPRRTDSHSASPVIRSQPKRIEY